MHLNTVEEVYKVIRETEKQIGTKKNPPYGQTHLLFTAKAFFDMRQKGTRNDRLVEVTVRGQGLEPLHHGDQTVGGVVSERKILKLERKKTP